MDKLVLNIQAVAFGGSGIARLNGKVYFVPDGVPEDKVEVRVTEEKKKYCTAEIVSFIEKSPLRSQSPCPYSSECGGCQWIEIDYSKQLEWKKSFVTSSLSRIGKLPEFNQDPGILPSPNQFNYRNKILLRSRIIKEEGKNKIVVGFFKKSTRDFIRIKTCMISDSSINLFLEEIQSLNFSEDLVGLEFKIEVQSLYQSRIEGTPLVIVTIYPATQDKLEVYDPIKNTLSTLTIVERCSLIMEEKKRFLLEKDTIKDKELSFYTAQSQFQQVNIDLNKKLRRMIFDKVPEKAQRVLDLFCGSGNLSLALKNEYVEGIEISPLAIETAKYNVEKNGLDNRVYLAGSSEAHLWKCVKNNEKFDIVIADPPREGMYKEVIPLSILEPETIIYVSCSPPTLARDIATLSKKGYEIKDIICLDFFPNTFHVETVVTLSKVK